MRIRAGRQLLALLAVFATLLLLTVPSPASAQDKSLIKEIQQRGELRVGYAVAGYLLAFEERDLIAGLGDTYRTYRAEVPAVIPRPLVP